MVRLALALLLVFVASCSCDGADTTTLEPRLAVGPGLPAGTDGTLLLDFGEVAIGAEATRLVELRNAGTSRLEVEPLALEAPFIGPGAEPLVLPPGGSAQVSIRFRPTSEGSAEALLHVRSNGGALDLRLVGRGVVPTVACEPGLVHFGNVLRWTEYERTVTCENRGSVATVLGAGPMEGESASFFRQSLEAPTELAPGATVAIRVKLFAETLGSMTARFSLAAGTTALGSIDLAASVFASSIEVEPTGSCADFGFVQLGESSERTVRIRNTGNETLRISGLGLDAGPFSLQSPPQTPFEIPADDPLTAEAENERLLILAFTPTSLGRQSGTLWIDSSDRDAPRIEVCLSGFGGGPVLQCNQASLDFGPVAIGTPLVRTLLCTNVGTPVEGTDEDDLRILGASSDSDEFSAAVRTPAAGYPAGSSFALDATYLPLDEGRDFATLTLATSAGELAVPLAGEGLDLLPCSAAVRPPRLAFGSAVPGAAATLEFTVRNEGRGDCLIRDLDLDPDSSSAFSLPDGPIDSIFVAAGSELRVPVSFSPAAAGEAFAGTVRMQISNPSAPALGVPLSGSALPACLRVVPGSVDFGKVVPGCSTGTRSLRAINTCAAPVTVRSATMALGSAPSFTVNAPGLPVQLFEGDTWDFEVAWVPVGPGSETGGVLLLASDSEIPQIVPLAGEGDETALHEDRWIQQNAASVDVLLVIDNSGSMANEQAAIAANMPALLDFASSEGTDFQIGVTTTGTYPAGGNCPGGADGGEDGRLYPINRSHPRILTPQTPDLATHYAYNIQVGACHDLESGLIAMRHALSTPTVDHDDDPRWPQPADGNLGFLRPDASLSVVFVTDDNDHSPDTVGSYFNFLLSLKGYDPSRVSAHAIVGTQQTCDITPAVGHRYLELVRRAGGVVQEICTDDWAATLHSIGTAAFATRNRFPLSGVPMDLDGDGAIRFESGEISVWIDGREAEPETGRGTRWTYDEATNQVVFSPLFRPGPGEEVAVRYRMNCL